MDKKTYQQIIDDAYMGYKNDILKMIESWDANYHRVLNTDADGCRPYTQEAFINRIKTDNEFANTWGLKIGERTLSLEERKELARGKVVPLLGSKEDSYNQAGIPTKLITISYNNETIEVYE